MTWGNGTELRTADAALLQAKKLPQVGKHLAYRMLGQTHTNTYRRTHARGESIKESLEQNTAQRGRNTHRKRMLQPNSPETKFRYPQCGPRRNRAPSLTAATQSSGQED